MRTCARRRAISADELFPLNPYGQIAQPEKMYLGMPGDRHDRVCGRIAHGRHVRRDHRNFKPGPAHTLDGAHQIDVGDAGIDVAALHHCQIHPFVADLLRYQAKLRVGDFRQVAGESANDRRRTGRLRNARFGPAIFLRRGLRMRIRAREPRQRRASRWPDVWSRSSLVSEMSPVRIYTYSGGKGDPRTLSRL